MTTEETRLLPGVRLAILTSHPIQYYAPLFRALSKHLDLEVFYAFQPTPEQQGDQGFGQAITWDIDLLSGYPHTFLRNIAPNPGTGTFSGCDTPEIAQKLRSGNFTHFLVIGWYLKSLVQGIIAAKRLGLKILVRGDSTLLTSSGWLKRLLKALTYPLMLRIFDAALYVGERNRAYYRHYAYPEERLFFSPHAVETDRFSEAVGDPARADFREANGIGQEFVVAFVGKLMGIKSAQHIVKAVAELRKRGTDAVLLVAGSGVEEDSLRSCATRLSVPVCFLGFVNQMQLPAVYAAADVLMLASVSETWGLVCNESFAARTPVLVADRVGCAPDLADGTVGRVYAYGDVTDAADQLEWFRDNAPSTESFSYLIDKYSYPTATLGILAAIQANTGDIN